MSLQPKARVGDFINTDHGVRRVMDVNVYSPEEVTYFLDDGGCLGDEDFSDEDVLLESEVIM